MPCSAVFTVRHDPSLVAITIDINIEPRCPLKTKNVAMHARVGLRNSICLVTCRFVFTLAGIHLFMNNGVPHRDRLEDFAHKLSCLCVCVCLCVYVYVYVYVCACLFVCLFVCSPTITLTTTHVSSEVLPSVSNLLPTSACSVHTLDHQRVILHLVQMHVCAACKCLGKCICCCM